MAQGTWSPRDDAEYAAGMRLLSASACVRMHVKQEARSFRDGAQAAAAEAGAGSHVAELAAQAVTACEVWLDRWEAHPEDDPLVAYPDFDNTVKAVADRIRRELEPVYFTDQAAYLKEHYGVSLAEATPEQRHEAVMQTMRTIQPADTPEEREAARQMYEQLRWAGAVIDYALSDDDPLRRRNSWWPAIIQRLTRRRSRPNRHDPR